MPRVNKSQYAILGMLNKQPMSGYDLKSKFLDISLFHWSESNAQIYPMLKVLEKSGMVTSEIDAASGARKRRIYTITPEGLKHLNAWLRQPIDTPKYREDMLLKLSSSQHLPSTLSIKHIEFYRDDLLLRKKLLDKVITTPDEKILDEKGKLYVDLTYDYTAKIIDAKLSWCSEAIKSLKDHHKKTT